VGTSKGVAGGGGISIGELRYFGTREQGQSVLHDGQLTLTKNLNVPRIGPPLDADDTPRRDRLVVEYNTSTNPTFEGAVRDTSGRGNDGVFYGTNMKYSSIEKAFEFNGTDDYVSVKASGVKGSSLNTSYSFSIWIKMTNTASAAVFITVGTSASGEMIGLRMSNGTTTYFVYHYAGDSATTGTTYGVSQEWRHVALTWNNSHQTIYIDGVLAVTETASSTFLNIPDNPNINLGFRPDGGGSTEYFKGYQSNPKIYDCTLTAEEVKTLYDMGRCDEGHHVVNFSKTRVGIGLGDGEAPQAALDVRGRILREYNPGEVIEELNSNCDGSILMVQSGSYTMTDVTASQTSTATHAVINGSSINYTAPLGAKRVYYTFAVHWDDNSFGAITHFKIQVDGTDIDPSRYTHAAQYQGDGNHHGSSVVRIEYSFDCNASSNDTSNGKFTSWTSPKTIRVTWRHYGSAINNHYQSNLHQNTWWDGSGSGVSGTTIMKPHLTIRAIA
jgi:hypothetical protein